MSARLTSFDLREEGHELMDDLESFVWMLIYMGHRYLEDSLDSTRRFAELKAIFDEPHSHQGMGGSNAKLTWLASMFISHGRTLTDFRVSGFNPLLKQLTDIFHSRYATPSRRENYKAIEAVMKEQPNGLAVLRRVFPDLALAPEILNERKWLSKMLRASGLVTSDRFRRNPLREAPLMEKQKVERQQVTALMRSINGAQSVGYLQDRPKREGQDLQGGSSSKKRSKTFDR